MQASIIRLSYVPLSHRIIISLSSRTSFSYVLPIECHACIGFRDVFNYEVATTGERPLTRQLREAQRIASNTVSGQLINGRNGRNIVPAFQQLTPVDILDRDRGRAVGQ